MSNIGGKGINEKLSKLEIFLILIIFLMIFNWYFGFLENGSNCGKWIKKIERKP